MRITQAEDAIDMAANYARRGRKYKSLPARELGERWAQAFRATVAQPDEEQPRLAEQDLSAEHQLRGIQPPYDKVSAHRDDLVSQLIAKMDLLGPDGLEAFMRKECLSSDRNHCRAQLNQALDAISLKRARIEQQRSIVRTLTRRRSPMAKAALSTLRELEHSLASSEKSRDLYTDLLRRWS